MGFSLFFPFSVRCVEFEKEEKVCTYIKACRPVSIPVCFFSQKTRTHHRGGVDESRHGGGVTCRGTIDRQLSVIPSLQLLVKQNIITSTIVPQELFSIQHGMAL